MTDSALDAQSTRRSRSHAPPDDRDASPIDPRQLARWLDRNGERLSARWLGGIRRRDGRMDDRTRELVEAFIGTLVSFLPAFLGPYREQVQPLWQQATETYGSVAAKRGLAAGEVIEEFQLLRAEILRLFYDDPPVRNLDRLPLRDVLRINRVVDEGVTHASVGHTDALFFALFQGTGAPESLSEEQAEGVHEQLRAAREEFREVMKLLDD